MKNKNEKAFTLIESLVVLFIIGLLSVVAGIGYGEASRQKKIEQAARSMQTQILHTRDAAIFGEPISDIYPCGYGVIFRKNNNSNNSIDFVYIKDAPQTSNFNDNFNRVTTMEHSTTCDKEMLPQSIGGQERPVYLDINNTVDSSLKSLSEGTSVESIKQSNDNVSLGDEISGNCLTVLFSSPRGGAYYYISPSGGNCDFPPAGNQLRRFYDQPKYFNIILNLTEGSSTATKYLKIDQGGNVEVTSP